MLFLCGSRVEAPVGIQVRGANRGLTMGAGIHKIGLVVATGNPGKFREMVALLQDLDLDLVPLDRVTAASLPAESGDSFQANARIKAEAAARLTGLAALADDSGLEVDALGGQPGVHSARFGGPGKTDAERCHLLLDKLKGIPPERRTARFRCAVAIAWPPAETRIVEGRCEGRIALAPRGSHGFGYDPLFEVPGLGRTLAELPPEAKNRMSHRAQAVARARHLLETWLGTRGRG